MTRLNSSTHISTHQNQQKMWVVMNFCPRLNCPSSARKTKIVLIGLLHKQKLKRFRAHYKQTNHQEKMGSLQNSKGNLRTYFSHFLWMSSTEPQRQEHFFESFSTGHNYCDLKKNIYRERSNEMLLLPTNLIVKYRLYIDFQGPS